MNFRRNSKDHTPDLNMTPLVDVVLLLVLFFMVTAQFSVLPGLKLVLPGIEPNSRANVQAGERLEITVTADGDIYFEDQITTMKNLPLHLERTGTAGSEVVIVVKADRSVPYGQIIKIMDTLRLEGFTRVVFAASYERDGEGADKESR